jgi:hypothetical protein
MQEMKERRRGVGRYLLTILLEQRFMKDDAVRPLVGT